MKKLMFEKKKVILEPCCYEDGKLAVRIKIGCSVDVLTVNLNAPLGRNKAYININNSLFDDTFLEWLKINEIAERTGEVRRSGFCCYPEVKFNENFLKENFRHQNTMYI